MSDFGQGVMRAPMAAQRATRVPDMGSGNVSSGGSMAPPRQTAIDTLIGAMGAQNVRMLENVNALEALLERAGINYPPRPETAVQRDEFEVGDGKLGNLGRCVLEYDSLVARVTVLLANAEQIV